MGSWSGELSALVEHRGDVLAGCATLLAGEARRGEELTRDAIVRVYSRRGARSSHPSSRDGQVSLVTGDDLGASEGRVRREIVASFLRSAERPVDPAPSDPAPTDPAPTDPLLAALGELTPAARACVVLHRYAGLDVPEVAAEVGVGEDVVRQDLLDADRALGPAALHALRKRAQHDGVDEIPEADAPGHLARELGALVDRVRRRRRSRSRRVAAATVAAAAIVGLVVAAPSLGGRATPAPSPSHSTHAPVLGSGVPGIEGLCSQHLDPDRKPTVDAWWRLEVSDAATSIAANSPWTGTLNPGLADGVDPTTVDDSVSFDRVALVLVQGGRIVAVGTQTLSDGDVMSLNGSAFPAVQSTLEACTTDTLTPGDYTAYALELLDPDSADEIGATGAQLVERMSNGVPLTVRAADTVAAGQYRPPWLDDTNLACGMSYDDVVTAMPTGDLSVGSVTTSKRTTYTVSNLGDGPVTLTMGTRMSFAWIDPKTQTVASYGADDTAGRKAVTLKHDASHPVTVDYSDTTDYCTPGADGTFTQHLPAGVYEVLGYTRALTDTGKTVWITFAFDLQVRVRADGSVTDDLGPGSAEALAQKGYQPAWVRGTSLRCGMSSEAFTDGSDAVSGAPVTVDGTTDDGDGSTGLLLAPAPGASRHVVLPRRATVAWFPDVGGQIGPLVSLGASPGEGRDVTVSVDETTLTTSLDAVDTCAPDGATYPRSLPAGLYWITPYTWVTDVHGARHWVASLGAQQVRVGADGSVDDE